MAARRRLRPALPMVLAVLGLVVHVGLRYVYWTTHYEEPFSDMRAYADIAVRILRHGSFEHSAFWQHYKPPTVPLLVASAFAIGGEYNLRAWQFAQLALCLVGLVWLAIEVARVSRLPWLGVGLIWVVALSRPSIFWSLKLATEGVAEGFVLLCAAALIAVNRRASPGRVAALGGLCTVAALARPNLFAVVPVALLCVPIWAGVLRGRGVRSAAARATILGICFGAGLLVVWAPWLARSWHLYGHLVPFSTQGPYSMLWELGDVTIDYPGGLAETRNVAQLQAEAPSRFPNDYEAQRHANRFVAVWLREHWTTIPALVLRRVRRSLGERSADLSRLPREGLYSAPAESLLLDKTVAVALAGFLGLGLLVYLCGVVLLPILLLPMGTLLAGLLFLSAPRIADPVVPLLLFGNLGWVVATSRLVARVRWGPITGLGQVVGPD